jgi:hypothetical protein
MLTCYGSLSRNRTGGVRLGQGERLEDILSSSSQVAEGVPTAGMSLGARCLVFFGQQLVDKEAGEVSHPILVQMCGPKRVGISLERARV